MNEVKVGLIGAGATAKLHLSVIAAIDGIKAVGITSRTKSRAQDLANAHGIEVCADNIEQLVQQAKPDALLVLVTETQTLNVVKDAMRHQLPLFVEKPAGLTPEENKELADLAAEHNIKSMVGYNRRFYSLFHKGLDIINQHGPLYGVMIEGHERMWRIHEGGHFSKEIMRDWIYANSTHTIDLLRFFGGEPSNFNCITHSYVEEKGDQFAAIMELSSGAIGQYHAHWYSPGGWRVVLYGEGATVEFKPLESGRWTDKNFVTHEIEVDEVDVKFKAGFYRQMEAFRDLVAGKEVPSQVLDLAGAYKTMRLAQQLCEKVQKKTCLKEEFVS